MLLYEHPHAMLPPVVYMEWLVAFGRQRRDELRANEAKVSPGDGIVVDCV